MIIIIIIIIIIMIIITIIIIIIIMIIIMIPGTVSLRVPFLIISGGGLAFVLRASSLPTGDILADTCDISCDYRRRFFFSHRRANVLAQYRRPRCSDGCPT